MSSLSANLEALRKPGLSVPPPSLIYSACIPSSSPTRGAEQDQFAPFHETIQSVSTDLAGRWLAIDLDDTLLVGSYTNAESWGALGDAVPSLNQRSLHTDWVATTKRLLRGHPQRVPSQQHHPFLTNPAVEVAFRPHFLEGLATLKSAGLGLVLVTASARQRVDFLVARFPQLDQLFSGELGRIVSAEDLAHAALIAESAPSTIDHPPSARAHQLRPRSIAAKTPWAISHITGLPHYDLLIDDSDTTAELFANAELDNKLLHVHGSYPWSNYASIILAAALDRLLGKTSPSNPLTKLPCPPQAQSLPPNSPPPQKVEDPLYYPLLHYKDQF